jgi:hypothetical protein
LTVTTKTTRDGLIITVKHEDQSGSGYGSILLFNQPGSSQRMYGI